MQQRSGTPSGTTATAVAPSRRAHAGWLAGLALCLLTTVLSACVDQVPPLLELAPNTFLELSSDRSTVVLTNAGGGALKWQASSDNPLVALSATQGRILRGASRVLSLTVDSDGLDLGDVVQATIAFDSNGGDATVFVSYTVATGIGQCGAYLPPESSATTGSSRVARSAAPAATARPVPGQVLVGYRPWSEPAGSAGTDLRTSGPSPSVTTAGVAVRVDPVAAAVRAQVVADGGAVLLQAGSTGAPDLFRSDDPDRLVASLLDDPRVAYAQRNYYLELQHVPDDTSYGQQWNMNLFGMPQAWNVYRGEAGAHGDVVIAIIDSGVYGDHPDFSGKLLPGWDFHDGDRNTSPGAPNGHAEHGTHVAGIAAALGDDGYGVAGVAYGPAMKILPVKVFDAAGVNATISDLVRAIRWSAGLAVAGVPTNTTPANVINMSLGVAGVFPALDAAAADAWNAGSLLVAASGNHTGAMIDPGVLSPANAPCVIAVGSVDSDYGVSSFSNTGPQLELVAPGGFSNQGCARVYSTLPPPDWHGCSSGTSMASPFVAGVAALLIGQGEYTTPAAVRDRLSLTAFRSDHMLATRSYGNGVVCADAALGASTLCGLH